MKNLTRLFHDLSVYREIVTQSVWRSLGRFAFAYFVIAAIYVVHFTATELPQVIEQFTTAASAISESIPESAEISLTNATLSTKNLTTPLTIITDNPDFPNPFIYLDQKASATDLATAAAAISFGQTHAKIVSETGSSTLINYQQEGFPDFTLTGKLIKDSIALQLEFLPTLRPLIPVILTLPIWIFFISLRFFHAFFYAAILKLVSYLAPSRPPLATFLKITLSTIIVADTVTALILILYQNSYPAIFSTAFVGVTLLVLLKTPAPGKIG